MNAQDLEIFDQMPFFFWAKNETGKYLTVNLALAEMSPEKIVGKTDHELAWAEQADTLRAVDKKVLETGEPSYQLEKVNFPGKGLLTVSTCKFTGEFNGEKCTYGVSFVIP